MDQEEVWVRERVQAVVSLYGITPDGAEAIQALDVRWMRDQPGFFGSYGYKSWTGVGEARPIGVMHELSHAYWGLFPVSGFPRLSWDVPEGEGISPAMEKYHGDMLEFMRQPPDQFELLRRRLRDLPALSSSNPGPLFHTVEADTVYITAGDLELVPPILRKYWDQFLQPGPFHSWYEALARYQSLPAQQKRLADKYIGLEHFDLRGYGSLKALEATRLQSGVEEILLGEETQRLRDFVASFDTLSAYVVGTREDQEDFKFWRRYLRDKVGLHKQHPELVASLRLPRSQQIASALEFLKDIEGMGADERAGLVIRELEALPFLVHFLPALDNRTLLELFTSDADLPEAATLKGTAAFVESLKRFARDIDRILEAGRRDISGGAEELTSYLNKADFQEKQDLGLFFEILEGTDSDTARAVVAALDDTMLRRLLKAVPAKLRVLLTPPRFLEFLDITPESTPGELDQGIEEMVTFPSGNFLIDEPFLDEMYGVVAVRGEASPLETLNVIVASPFPMERFIRLYPAAAVDLLASDLDIAVEMVRDSDTIVFPPARFVYRLIYAAPEFAARLVERLDELGDHHLVIESLAHFAYDADRLQAIPEARISLHGDGRFLKRLLEERGEEWLGDVVEEAVRLYGQRVESTQVSADFLAAYQRTLKAAASAVDDGPARRALERIIRRSFQP